VHADAERPAERRTVERMAETLRHRGPDSAGFFVADNVALGFRRLKIIDFETGDQPLYSEDGAVVVVCNGEIFNHRELRDELAGRGHAFRTRSDVEVIVHLYEDLGVDCVGRLNGQFAFVVYDRRRRRLVMARDHVGIAPLFYGTATSTLVFGSEIKAILAYPGTLRRVDVTGLDQVLSLPGLVSPRTMFEGVKSLPPGHYAIVTDGEAVVSEYWDLDYPRQDAAVYDRSEADYVAALDEALTESIRLRLHADVPVGCYLSGGLDSSLIAAKTRALRPAEPLRTFSIAFRDRAFAETPYQRLVAERVHSVHHEVSFDVGDIVVLLPRAIAHAECPLKETYNTASLRLSAAAKEQGVSAILTGEGADELFAGYIGYRFDRFRAQQRADAATSEPPAEAMFRDRVFGDPALFYERSAETLRTRKAELYGPAIAEALRARDCFAYPLVNRDRVRGRHPCHQRSYLDFKLRLGDHLLADHGDRMALANAVEVRYPFLDVHVLECARTMPPQLKLNDFVEKYVVRRVAAGLVPAEIIEREKFAFAAPGGPALAREHAEWVEALLAEARIKREGYFNSKTVEALKARYRQRGFRLTIPYDDDLLVLLITFELFLDAFDLRAL
jgi:asparagine synthase (glutamine-hydrolysing)